MAEHRSLAATGGAIALIVGLGLAGCQSEQQLPQVSAAQAARHECPPITSDEYYYPEGVLYPHDEGEDRVQRTALSPLLKTANQLSLSCGSEVPFGIRVSFLSSSGIHFVLLERTADRWWYDRSTVAVEAPHAVMRAFGEIPPVQAKRLVDAFDAADLWTAEAFPRSLNNIQDGESILIEGRNQTAYRVVTRSKGSPLAEAAENLWTAAGGQPR